jgi:hypothetical protein
MTGEICHGSAMLKRTIRQFAGLWMIAFGPLRPRSRWRLRLAFSPPAGA